MPHMDLVQIRHFILRCNIDTANDFSQTVQLPHFKQISDFTLKITFQIKGKMFTNLFSQINLYCVETTICVHGCIAFVFITCIFCNLVIWYKLIHTKVFIYLIGTVYISGPRAALQWRRQKCGSLTGRVGYRYNIWALCTTSATLWPL